MKNKMIKYNFYANTRHWSRRIKKIDSLVKKILIYKKDLKFSNKIDYHCNFIFTNDKFIKKINKKYKNINKTTDVLTFVSKIKYKNKKELRYCDIIFSIGTIKKDIKINNIEFYNHLTHLIIHSFLHINDFVHSKMKDYLKMKNLEINILRKLKIENPY